MKMTVQQSAVVEFARKGKGNAFVVAVAGAGKTSTLVEACKAVTAGKTIAFAAYNRKIADEIKAKTGAVYISAKLTVNTFHAFGFSAVRYANKSAKLDDKAKSDALGAYLKTLSYEFETFAFARKVVSLLKMELFDGYNDSTVESVIEKHNLMESLPESVEMKVAVAVAKAAFIFHLSHYKRTGIMDFDDMIYLPSAYNLRMFQNDFVFIDEAQDTNPARLALTRKMLKADGCAIFVGDPAQAIYGFTGADSDSIATIKTQFKTVELPLTVSFRCPKLVVAEAQKYVSHIESAGHAINGTVSRMESSALLSAGLNKSDAILCRNTKPLVETAFLLIRNGIGAHVEGKDIGKGLLNLVTKWKSVKTVKALDDKLESYLNNEMDKFKKRNNELAADAVKDRVDTLRVIMESCDTLRCVVEKINSLFEDTNGASKTVTLSTVHKSKGREWTRVFVLGQNLYMPSPYAKKDWQLEQEYNLIYVAYTRSMDTLIHVDCAKKK